MIRTVAIIPCYRHDNTLFNVIKEVQKNISDVIVVDDGNEKSVADNINAIAKQFANVIVLTNEINIGKGGSLAKAIHFAKEKGYSHAIQIDADGQHNADDIIKLLKLCKENPDCVISGAPIYDDDAPRSRVIGRKITNFFVHIETLSFMIKDAMIGFRAYPVNITDKIITEHNLKSRMTFDIEILVRLAWSGIKVLFFDTKVEYPKNGISNFKAIDQLRISWMHTKLCAYSFLTLPVRIFKNAR